MVAAGDGVFQVASAEATKALWEGLRALQVAAAAHVDAAMAIDKKAQDLVGVLSVEAAKLEEARHLIDAQRAALDEERGQLEATARGCDVTPVVQGDPTDGGSGAAGFITPLPPPASPGPMMLSKTMMQRGGAVRNTPHLPPEFTSLVQPQTSRSRRSSQSSVSPSKELTPLDYAANIEGWSYAVLPPRPADDTRPSHDMVGQVVSVPEGWEVLSTGAENFPSIIRSLASRGWGTLRLCARDPDGGLANFSTALRPFGVPGERESNDVCVLEEVEGAGGRRFKFSDCLVSGRLVVRVSSRR
mmetsp:Transcript_103564/g.259704  ORF Transcript_103564/g.259704 Transcript_103564/m.259704 type:complete len:301 (+) Transcript_103564:103-1005(+)